jgi:radical SAM protein with 4Fe4S-binding SPASM domain
LKPFERINIEINNVCNLHCSFCPPQTRQSERLTPEDFRGILKKVKPYTKEVTLHLLGEPLGHPELGEIIEQARLEQVPVLVVTNGVLLSDDIQSILLNPIVRQVAFSLQSFSSNFPNRDPINYLTRIKEYCDSASSQRPEQYVNLRLWDIKDDPLETTNDSKTEQDALDRMRERLSEVFEFKWSDVKINIPRTKSWRIRSRIYLHCDSRFVWPDMKNEILQHQGTCKALTDHIGIHADGTVVACCLSHKDDLALGYIKTTSLEDILASPRAVAMKEGFQRGQLTEDLCKRCGYISRFSKAKKPAF